MSTCPPISYGIQAMLDASLTVAGTGLSVGYRVLNAPPRANTNAAEHGFVVTVTDGTGGTTDIPIYPQPSVKSLSMFDIAQSAGKYNEMTKQFVVSDTFVNQMMQRFPAITEQDQVFDGFNQFLGLVYEGRLYNVISYAHNEIAGATVGWVLKCNASGQQ